MARAIALGHHERWDGSGYPSGARGEEAPLAARIVMLADQYDALRTRPPLQTGSAAYRGGGRHSQRDGRTLPQHFDPVLLEVFREIHPRLEAVHARFAD